MNRSSMPESIKLPGGEVLKPVIGGCLENAPFLTSVDVTKNGWANGLFDSQIDRMIVEEAKRRKLKYRRVKILHRNLRGKNDLHGNRYVANVWVFVQV